MSAVLVVQIELSVRHGRSFITRLRLGIGRHCRPPPARSGADPASRTHSAGQQPGTRTEPTQRPRRGLAPGCPAGHAAAVRTARTDDRRNLP
jgi:hypothetical protein